MKKQLAAVWCGGASAVAMAALMVACGGDVSPSTAPRVDGTSTTDSARPVPDPPPGSDAPPAARDASDELEGGGLLPIEPDAGVEVFEGYVTVTPLQMASVIGTVANDGVSIKPRLVQAVMNRATGDRAEFPPTVRGKIAVKPATLALIKSALADVVTKGTATRAKSSLVTIGGKTGTAQTAALRTAPEKDIPKKFRDHAWFVAFAPVEAPRIAVAVLAEHMGHGGSAPAPLAKDVIEPYVKAYPQVLHGVPASGRTTSPALPADTRPKT